MNPLTNMKNVLKLSERDLQQGGKSSWHDMYKGSAWIFVGGLPFDLTEGDIITVFSQYGEIVNINLIRDKLSGKSKGFCFICYEDQRSTTLTVDNLNGIKILNRTLRVDHVSDYKPPKEGKKTDEVTRRLYMEGCAPKLQIPEENIKREEEPSNPPEMKREPSVKAKKEKTKKSKKEKKSKKGKKEKKSKKKKRKRDPSSSEESSSDSVSTPDNNDDSAKKTRQRSRSRSPRREKQESIDSNRKEDKRERDTERRRRSRSR